jgi:Fe-S-cluster containining protein
MTPLEKSDSVVNKYKSKFTRSLKEVRWLSSDSPRSIDYKAVRMLEIIDGLGALVAPVSSCKKGCSYCCYQAVVISTWEADRIAKYAKRKTNGFGGHTETIKHIQEQFCNVVCPFLVNDACSIYPARPFMCRAHYSFSDDPTACDIALNPGTTVPYFNFENYKGEWAKLFILDDFRFGDIREFFEK